MEQNKSSKTKENGGKKSQIHENWTTCSWNIGPKKKSEKEVRDLTDGPMNKNLPCNAGDVASIPGQGTKFPHAAE